MTDKADHIAWAAEAVAVFQRHCRTGDEHPIADLDAQGDHALRYSFIQTRHCSKKSFVEILSSGGRR
jgi:hypothetical protein